MSDIPAWTDFMQGTQRCAERGMRISDAIPDVQEAPRGFSTRTSARGFGHPEFLNWPC